MAQGGNLIPILTDKDLHFTGALATDAEERENIVLPAAISAGLHCRSRLRAIALISDQNLNWEIFLWGRDTFGDPADFDLNSFIGRWRFDQGDGVQIAGAGPFYYYVDGLDVPYEDLDNSGELHISLVNRHATAKNAGATGEIVLKLVFDPTLGW